MKTIGIIGGLGPEPTIEYYKTIITTFREKSKTNNSPEMIIYSLNLQKFLHMMETRQKQKASEYILKGIQNLHAAGADIALIAAGTPHIFLDKIQNDSPIPVLSMIEETVKVVLKKDLNRVGIMGTKYLMQSDPFQKIFSRYGILTIVPNVKEQEYIHNKLVDELQFGRIVESTRQGMLDIVKRMIDENIIQGLILGCTELPLILSDNMLDIPFFDTIKIHVESAVNWYYCNTLNKEKKIEN